MGLRRIIFLFFLWSANASIAQSYIPYFQQCNYADSLYANKELNQALEAYEMAFEMVESPHFSHLLRSAKVAIELTHSQLAWQRVKQSILRGCPAYLLEEEKVLKELLKKNKDSVEVRLTDFQSRIDKKLKSQIDSLHIITQYYSRGNKGFQKDANGLQISREQEERILNTPERKHFEAFIKIMDKYGFPGSSDVSAPTNETCSFLLMVSAASMVNYDYTQLLSIALNQGKILPESFAEKMDDIRQLQGLEPFFYFPANTRTPEKEERERINRLRRKYAIKPFEAYKKIAKANSWRIKKLWE